MRKIFYLSTCTTCKRILQEWNAPEIIQLQDIKSQLYTENEIDEMKKMSGSYEAIFSKRSQKYKAWNVEESVKSDNDYRAFLLKDYSFLKRPVLIFDETIFVGNAKNTIEQGKQFLNSIR